MKIGIVHGPYLNEWAIQSYLALKKYKIEPIGICSYDNWFDLSDIKIPIRKLKRFGQFNKIPLVSHGIQYFFPYNNYLLNFKKAIKDLDLLHSAEAFNVFSYQCVKSKKPTIITVFENIPFNNERFVYKKWKKIVYAKAKHIIAITNKAREAMVKEGVKEEKISVIPEGIDISRFKPEKRDKALLEKYDLPKDSINILFIGSLIWRKGILHLIESFRDLNKKNDKLYLLIAGKGPLKSDIIKMRKKYGINDKLKILDFVPYKEMHKIHNLADIFALPSIPDKTWEEQFGFVMVEAMACEKPIVSTLSGSIPEVVKNNNTGFLVKPNNIKELKNALERLILDKKLRRKLGKEGRRWVLKNFDERIISKKLASLYKEIL